MHFTIAQIALISAFAGTALGAPSRAALKSVMAGAVHGLSAHLQNPNPSALQGDQPYEPRDYGIDAFLVARAGHGGGGHAGHSSSHSSTSHSFGSHHSASNTSPSHRRSSIRSALCPTGQCPGRASRHFKGGLGKQAPDEEPNLADRDFGIYEDYEDIATREFEESELEARDIVAFLVARASPGHTPYFTYDIKSSTKPSQRNPDIAESGRVLRPNHTCRKGTLCYRPRALDELSNLDERDLGITEEYEDITARGLEEAELEVRQDATPQEDPAPAPQDAPATEAAPARKGHRGRRGHGRRRSQHRHSKQRLDTQ